MDIKNRTTRWITSLEPNEVFVFGSNESGRHGRGAAKDAMAFGATYGQASGISGQTYAIPTVNAYIDGSLAIEKIQEYISAFIRYAKNHPKKVFLVTEIGCNLAGYNPIDIAPLFKDAINVENISLPQRFWDVLL